MALTKVSRGLLSTGILDNSNATAITIDSSENVTFAGNILHAGALTLDVGGNIILDADGAEIIFKDGGTQFGEIYKSGNDLRLESNIPDGNLVFSGNDGGTGVVALTLDMSAGGPATFVSSVTAASLILNTSVNSSFSIINGGTNAIAMKAAASDELYIGANNSYSIRCLANGTNDVVMDNSSSLGIGTASVSTWTKLQVVGTAGAQTGATQALYLHSPTATANQGTGIRLSASSGSHEAVGIIGVVNNASGNSGSMTFHTYSGGGDIPERMRLDQSGNLIMTAGGAIRAGGANDLILDAGESGTPDIYFQSGGSSRMRLRGVGSLSVAGNGASVNTNANFHSVRNGKNNEWVQSIQSSGTPPYGMSINYTAAAPNGTSNYFLYCADTAAARFYVESNGNVKNRNSVYTGISDLKLKQDIVDASNQWDDIKNIRFRKYKFKTDVVQFGHDAVLQLGVIAQELEAAGMAGLVSESPDIETVNQPVLDESGNAKVDEDGNPITEEQTRKTGTTTKAVKYSVMTMKAMVALQEAMARIETLEAKVTALENN